jgi:hypothetical protein
VTVPTNPLRRLAAINLAALFEPWALGRRVSELRTAEIAALAALNIVAAAVLSTLLSSWAYLAGKGLLLGPGEMDLGQDDIPPDTAWQVATGVIGSSLVWFLLLALAVGLCVVVADTIFRRSRTLFRAAARTACAGTVWLVVWTLSVLLINGARHGELRHPAEAIRAYAQLRQQGFSGRSAVNPGAPEAEPLVVRGRLLAVAGFYPFLWSLALPGLDRRNPRAGRWRVVALAVTLGWLAWSLMWRLLPWVTIEAIAG